MAESLSNRIRSRDRITDKGHGTEALGPSGSSDTGSDIVGGPGIGHEADDLDLDQGATTDADTSERGLGATAGPDIGDADLDSDSDETGTGENLTAGRDPAVLEGQDIRPDRVIGSADPGGEIPRPWRRRPGDNTDFDFSDSEAGEAQEAEEGEQPMP